VLEEIASSEQCNVGGILLDDDTKEVRLRGRAIERATVRARVRARGRVNPTYPSPGARGLVQLRAHRAHLLRQGAR